MKTHRLTFPAKPFDSSNTAANTTCDSTPVSNHRDPHEAQAALRVTYPRRYAVSWPGAGDRHEHAPHSLHALTAKCLGALSFVDGSGRKGWDKTFRHYPFGVDCAMLYLVLGAWTQIKSPLEKCGANMCQDYVCTSGVRLHHLVS